MYMNLLPIMVKGNWCIRWTDIQTVEYREFSLKIYKSFTNFMRDSITSISSKIVMFDVFYDEWNIERVKTHFKYLMTDACIKLDAWFKLEAGLCLEGHE